MMDVQHLTPEALAAIFDHTLLRASASLSELAQLCAEARQYGFGMVAINSAPVAFCRGQLEGSPVHVGAAVSFPLGQTTLDVKLFETEKAIRDGADEIDYVTDLTHVKEHDLGKDISALTLMDGYLGWLDDVKEAKKGCRIFRVLDGPPGKRYMVQILPHILSENGSAGYVILIQTIDGQRSEHS